MISTAKLVAVILQVIVVGISAIVAQEREISKPEFWDYFRQSRETTKDIPFREKVTVEMGDLPSGPWEPYSSWVMENVFPDRTHTTYTSGRTGEILTIGKVSYRKDADGRWISTDERALPVSAPASQFVFEPPVVFDLIGFGKAGEKFQIRVVSKSKPGTDVDKERRMYTYSFDDKGVLFQSEAIVFNGSRWLRRIERFEYDPAIRIDAPAN